MLAAHPQPDHAAAPRLGRPGGPAPVDQKPSQQCTESLLGGPAARPVKPHRRNRATLPPRPARRHRARAQQACLPPCKAADQDPGGRSGPQAHMVTPATASHQCAPHCSPHTERKHKPTRGRLRPAPYGGPKSARTGLPAGTAAGASVSAPSGRRKRGDLNRAKHVVHHSQRVERRAPSHPQRAVHTEAMRTLARRGRPPRQHGVAPVDHTPTRPRAAAQPQGLRPLAEKDGRRAKRPRRGARRRPRVPPPGGTQTCKHRPQCARVALRPVAPKLPPRDHCHVHPRDPLPCSTPQAA